MGAIACHNSGETEEVKDVFFGKNNEVFLDWKRILEVSKCIG